MEAPPWQCQLLLNPVTGCCVLCCCCRLQLPPALTSPNLNFITVMLVDHGKVGPATQLLTMPSSAADEFSGLFRILVEHEMLPQHTAAHPEFVTMLFGSSGCSSGSTVHSYSTLFNSINSGSHSVPKAAVAAAGAKGRVSPTARAGQGVAAPTAAGLPGISNSFLQQQLLLQQGHGQHLRHQRKQKARRDSAGYVQVAGSPAVVKQWSATAAAGPAAARPDAAGRAAAAAAAAARASSTQPGASRSSGGWDTAAAVAAEHARRQRRASDGELQAMSLVEMEMLSNNDSSGQTLTTIDGSMGTANESQVLRMLASGPCGTDMPAGAAADGDSTQLPQQQEQEQLQLQQLEEQGVLCMGQESACNSEVLPRLASWASAGAADAPDQPAVALMMIGERDDVDGVHTDQAAAAASAAQGKADAHTQQQRHRQQVQQQLGQGVLPEPEGRKSLSLDRCAVHVHNEVERAQRTRTRMSLDEGARTRLSIDEAARAGSGGTLQMAQAVDMTADAVAAAAASTAIAVTAGSSLFASTDPTMAAAAAAAAAALRQQAPGRNGLATPAPGFSTFSTTPAAAAACGSTAAQAGAGVAVPDGAATGSSAGQQGAADAAGLGLAAGASGPAGGMMFGSSRGLERRTAAEASMAAAFTTAWTCHMLELASDLQACRCSCFTYDQCWLVQHAGWVCSSCTHGDVWCGDVSQVGLCKELLSRCSHGRAVKLPTTKLRHTVPACTLQTTCARLSSFCAAVPSGVCAERLCKQSGDMVWPHHRLSRGQRRRLWAPVRSWAGTGRQQWRHGW